MRLCDDHRRHTWAFSFLLAKPNQVAQTTSEDCELCAVGRHAFLALESVWPDMPESALSFEAKSRDVLENVEIFTTNAETRSLTGIPMAWFISADTSSKECLDRIKSWLSDCQENHPSCRAGWLEKATPLPKRVIDVGGSTLSTKDIVRIEESQGGDGPYIALSHCWGKVQLLTTTKETLRSRMAGISWSDLPPTFQEAITMTRHFGVRYLWIDSLCILQNDPQDWEEQSAEMGRIYGNAIITISATASSDSTQGLFRCAAPEYTAVKVVHGHEYQDIYARKRLQHDNYYPGPLNTNDFFLPLQTRAWVLQEHYLSPRVLQFSSDEVVWECNNGLHCECSEGHRPTAQLPPKSSWYGFLKSVDDPDAFDLRSRREAWSRLVSSYTTRKLTFPHDKLPAFSGLARVMQPYFGGRYLAGLWESDLVYGLGWYILNEILPSKPSGYRAPSWAWAAIDGKVQQQPFRESLIQVIEVVYELTSSNPFSTVRGASIRARGKIIKATLRYDVREERRGDVGYRLCIEDGTEPIFFYPDYALGEHGNHHVPTESTVHCFLIFHTLSESIKILVLRSVGPTHNTYERIGSTSLNKSNYDELFSKKDIMAKSIKLADTEITII